MTGLAFVGLSMGVGLGVLLVVQGIRGKEILPANGNATLPTLRAKARWIAAAVLASILVLAATGWPVAAVAAAFAVMLASAQSCLLYTSPSPRDATLSRMPSSA